ncbi:hypothetical protein KC315_g6422 [Hortaea werneckii]|nr:hypothetical protein KC315_g6422 [Hortaea werneckii]
MQAEQAPPYDLVSGGITQGVDRYVVPTLDNEKDMIPIIQEIEGDQSDDRDGQGVYAHVHATASHGKSAEPPPVDQSSSEHKQKTRLIICVDGTYCDADGPDTSYSGNSTNVHRISTVVHDGDVEDGKWKQKVVYRRGLNDSRSLAKCFAGAFGYGIEEEIKEVYKLVCEQNLSKEDELYLFGFSRGAYVVRAIAGLLHWMKIPKVSTHSPDFDRHYEQCLGLYQKKRAGDPNRQNSILQIARDSRQPPIIKFVGTFDTVKAYDDKDLYDIKLNNSIMHARQALALNERRTKFAPECLDKISCPRDGNHTMLQAWFLGRHSDIGGSNAQDGLSLYPLQWMLSEAHDCGLVLGARPLEPYVDESGIEQAFEDPGKLIFPVQLGQSLTSTNTGPFFFEVKNGIVVKLWDILRVHASHKRYGISLPSSPGNRVLYSFKDREISHDGKLVGYSDEEAFGTFIHPSVYMIDETEVQISINLLDYSFHTDILTFKANIEWGAEELFWKHPTEDIDGRLKAVRILICGEAGIGKSTLLNRSFGIDLSPTHKTNHGVHDVNVGLTGEGKHYIIHDSCGFQSGNTKDIDDLVHFIKIRGAAVDISERLHAVWYCIDSLRNRAFLDVDQQLFALLKEAGSQIPVILISTRLDRYKDLTRGEIESEYKRRHGIKRGTRLDDEAYANVCGRTDEAVGLLKRETADSFRQRYPGIRGPLFTELAEEDEDDSIRPVMTETINSIDNDCVRLHMIKAQICLIGPKIDSAVDESIKLYKHAVRTAAAPVPVVGSLGGVISTATVGGLIGTEICTIFGYSGSSLDLGWETLTTSLGNRRAMGAAVGGEAFMTGLGIGAMTLSGPLAVPLVWGTRAAVNVLTAVQLARLLLRHIADTILIMERAHWFAEDGNIDSEDIRRACQYYAGRPPQQQVHAEVDALLPTFSVNAAFDNQKMAAGLRKIIHKNRFQQSE